MESGLGAGELKTGVAKDSVPAGDEEEDGVEACSVANRSGDEAGALGRLHPTIQAKKEIVKKSLKLFIIQFN